MLAQIRLTSQLKAKIDALIEAGHYPDFNTAAVVALENLVVAEEEHKTSGKSLTASKISSGGIANDEKMSDQSPTPSRIIPDQIASASCFMWTASASEFKKLVHNFPTDRFTRNDSVPIERWPFGQQNRILPIKVNARLLLAMLVNLDEEPSLDKVRDDISTQAARVYVVLNGIDQTRGHKKDDLLSTAFPSPNSDKSRQRYADQFIASENTAGELSGLLIDWKLATVERKKGKPFLYPTEACIAFANIKNPLLDLEDASAFTAKFSDEEISWALGYITKHVYVEAFAFATLIRGIRKGANDPGSLDRYLRENGAVEHNKTTEEFIATQRSGALSRMADLDLVKRVRDGVRVSYAVTDRGNEWLKQL